MTEVSRKFDQADQVIDTLDQTLRTVFGRPNHDRPRPDADLESTTEDFPESGALMRVNHTGEVCAQALYQAQALTGRSRETKNTMRKAAQEENDHLAWCAERLEELNDRTSYLNPLWYAGSFGIGAIFGLLGDKWNLGFLAETERQVVRHLDRHLKTISAQDIKSRTIIEQMRKDESEHATAALNAGGRELPEPVKGLMRAASKVMTTVAAKI